MGCNLYLPLLRYGITPNEFYYEKSELKLNYDISVENMIISAAGV